MTPLSTLGSNPLVPTSAEGTTGTLFLIMTFVVCALVLGLVLWLMRGPGYSRRSSSTAPDAEPEEMTTGKQ